MNSKLKLGVIISGKGSNLKSLIEATQKNNFPAEIVIVIANVPNIAGIEIAEEASLPVCTINHNDFNNRELFEKEIHAVLINARVELVCLAGFMRILTDHFIQLWLNKIVNIHPSLLPSFKGLNTHERAIKSGAKFSGCTVHFVRPEMDSGPIIIQAAVPINQEDTPATLANRILVAEHKIYPRAVKLIASKRVLIKNNRVSVKDSSSTNEILINPNS